MRQTPKPDTTKVGRNGEAHNLRGRISTTTILVRKNRQYGPADILCWSQVYKLLKPATPLRPLFRVLVTLYRLRAPACIPRYSTWPPS